MKNKNIFAFVAVFLAIQLHATGSANEPTAAPKTMASGCNACIIASGVVGGLLAAYGIAGLVASNHFHHKDRNCCKETIYCNPSYTEEGQNGNAYLTCNAQGPGRLTLCIPDTDSNDPKWVWPVGITSAVALGAGTLAGLYAIIAGSKTCCGSQAPLTGITTQQ